MRLRQVLCAATAGMASMMIAAGPAAAAVPKADIAVKIQSSGHAPVGGTAMIVTELHNYGPNATLGGTLWVEINAPGGTVFAPDTANRLGGPGCSWITANRHVRCTITGMIYPDDDNPSGVYSFSTTWYKFVVKSRCTTAGRISYKYGNDPKLSNNSTALRVSVDGVGPASCTTPKPSPKPSTSPKPSPSSSASASLSPPAVVTTDPSVSGVLAATDTPSPDPVTELAGDADSAGPGATLAVVGGVAALIVGGGLLWRLRRRPEEQTAE